MIPGITAGSAAVEQPAAFRYIRLYITANNGGAFGDYTGLNELILRSVPGGSNYPAPPEDELTNPADAAAGAATASSFFPDNTPAEAFDQIYSGGNSWYTNTGASLPQWLKYDFGAGNAVEVREFVIIRAPDEVGVAGRFPRDFVLQGSNDNATWTDLKAVTGQTGWDAGTYQARVFPVP
ncbi:discoidin domain-containing protein [Xanthomonas sp. AM6]|uniref:discoidin domain-containing protein n=1 Tax=Xanthomonas sp. AM6 TaxID=2982531 RepID=UPI0021D98120|nr:discoidin domain-containing protein [Xanthomonas sp. AM6]UYB51140.1 discoidin domain-containing protein [Xanthomonas sp. AM6]